ncbi:type IV pilin-like G/H family protein [Crocosphaera sp. UHCC 0190]|uniref:type IV pilin protein n=1 Tax=Crocosphaera sp. UHCC 0190 TaxID=3110246 RepID=UPI002B212782|nr:type IV pilin-like G/H family protein [Crocosphaera sp. UHCC 0190]MEA5509453.1 type IV pilin-like G/H family protein [Crocosphaera sp. UHCC 0190]
MNNTFKANLIKSLANKKGNKGFTLIELLVVVIIIGVLAAIALPNLLGQVGKARESEAKSTIGAMTRAQQSFFTEKGRFAGDDTLDGASLQEKTEALEVPTGNEKYYLIGVTSPGVQLATGSDDAKAEIIAGAPADAKAANQKNGTRDYISGIAYDTNNRTFASVVCRATNALKAGGYVLTDTNKPTGSNDAVDDAAVECATDTEVIR